jgi:hypothetical protein
MRQGRSGQGQGSPQAVALAQCGGGAGIAALALGAARASHCHGADVKCHTLRCIRCKLNKGVVMAGYSKLLTSVHWIRQATLS